MRPHDQTVLPPGYRTPLARRECPTGTAVCSPRTAGHSTRHLVRSTDLVSCRAGLEADDVLDAERSPHEQHAALGPHPGQQGERNRLRRDNRQPIDQGAFGSASPFDPSTKLRAGRLRTPHANSCWIPACAGMTVWTSPREDTLVLAPRRRPPSRTARRHMIEPSGSSRLGISHMHMSVGHATLAGLLLSVEGVMGHRRR